MKHLFRLLLITTAAVGTIAANAAKNPEALPYHFIHSNDSHYTIHGHQVRFSFNIRACDEVTLDNFARNVKNESTTDRWDDRWYVGPIPQGKCAVLAFYDLTAKKYAWAAAENAPSTWYMRSMNTGWKNVGNGDTAKFRFSIEGATVDFDFYNPKNTAATSGNDVYLGFGY